MVPAMNVQHFIGRVQLLERMDKVLAIGQTANERPKVRVLQGMGGQKLTNPQLGQNLIFS